MVSGGFVCHLRWDLSDMVHAEERLQYANPYRLGSDPFYTVKLDTYHDLFREGMVAALIEPSVLAEEVHSLRFLFSTW